ncbi:MAG: bacterio-opsin activator domain-containing protein [Halanaeroarchaeum sp.]
MQGGGSGQGARGESQQAVSRSDDPRPVASATFRIDEERRIRSWSEAAAHLTGYDAATVVGEPVAMLLAESNDQWETRALDWAEAHSQVDGGATIERADGSRLRVVASVTVELDADGETAGYLAAIRAGDDVRDVAGVGPGVLGQWELFERSPDTIVVHDVDGEILTVNDRAAEDLGYDRATLRSMNVADLDAERSRAELREVWEGLDVGDRIEAEGKYRRGDGSVVPMEIWASKLDTGRGARILAFGRDVTERDAVVGRLQDRTNSLERVHRLTESFRPLNRSLARSSTVEQIQSVVCEQLVDTGSYSLAWFGEYDPLARQVVPQTGAGEHADVLESIVLDLDGAAAGGPAARAVQSGTVEASRDVDPESAAEPWRVLVAERDVHAVAAIPITVEENVYGVVALYADRSDAFDEDERNPLADLADRVGQAIHAAEHRRLLHVDSVVELVFRTQDEDSPFVATATACDCRLDLVAMIPAADRSYVGYATVEGADPQTVVDTLAAQSGIVDPRVVHEDGRSGTVEFRVTESPVTKLLEHGSTVTEATIEPGRETVVGQVAPGTATNGIVAGMRSAYPDVELVAKRTVDRPVTQGIATDEAAMDALTDRQREALTLAYHAGFFESPRHSSGEELADALGIAPPTVYLHVRRATRNLLDRLVGDGGT